MYNIIANSKVSTDINIFFSWCSQNLAVDKSDEFQPLTDEINSKFFKERIESDSSNMRLEQLPMEGFKFLENMFRSENSKKQQRGVSGSLSNITEEDDIDDRKQKKALRQRGTLPEDPSFYVTIEPDNLEQIKVMWKVALLVEVPEVKRTAAAFLVNLYLNVYTKKPISKDKNSTENPTEQ